MSKDYRLRIVDRNFNRDYITRRDGAVSYFSGSQTPLTLYDLVRNDAAELRFALEDAADGNDAAIEVEIALDRHWKQRNFTFAQPRVEVLAEPRR